MIQHAKDCLIKIYLMAMFEDDLSALGADASEMELQFALQTIHEEFLDVSGMQKSESAALLKKIEMLQLRLKLVGIYVKIHRDCFSALNEPFHPAIEKLKEFGYRLSWNKENPQAFIKDLDAIEKKEKRYEAELKVALKNYEKMQQKESGSGKTKKSTRLDFLSNINNLNRFGFSIDKDKNTMEELGLMIKDYDEYIKVQNMKSKK